MLTLRTGTIDNFTFGRRHTHLLARADHTYQYSSTVRYGTGTGTSTANHKEFTQSYTKKNLPIK